MFQSHRIDGVFTPTQDWVVLRPVKEPERIRGGLLLPERVEDYGRCEVISIGPGYKPYRDGLYSVHFIPTLLKVGEFVFIQKFVEGELKFVLNGDTVFITRERHLNLVIEGDPFEVAKTKKRAKKKLG